VSEEEERAMAGKEIKYGMSAREKIMSGVESWRMR
jgi:hypothetical protein